VRIAATPAIRASSIQGTVQDASHFFNPAVQLNMSVSGVAKRTCPPIVISRRVGEYVLFYFTLTMKIWSPNALDVSQARTIKVCSPLFAFTFVLMELTAPAL
jgi:hypothetical protein